MTTIRGEKGENGKDFRILGTYDTLDILSASVPNEKREQGDFYAVGTAIPYLLYMYDTKKGWVNHGQLGIDPEPPFPEDGVAGQYLVKGLGDEVIWADLPNISGKKILLDGDQPLVGDDGISRVDNAKNADIATRAENLGDYTANAYAIKNEVVMRTGGTIDGDLTVSKTISGKKIEATEEMSSSSLLVENEAVFGSVQTDGNVQAETVETHKIMLNGNNDKPSSIELYFDDHILGRISIDQGEERVMRFDVYPQSSDGATSPTPTTFALPSPAGGQETYEIITTKSPEDARTKLEITPENIGAIPVGQDTVQIVTLYPTNKINCEAGTELEFADTPDNGYISIFGKLNSAGTMWAGIPAATTGTKTINLSSISRPDAVTARINVAA